MIWFSIVVIIIALFCLAFELGRLYEINCNIRELDIEIARIDAKIEAIDEIEELLAEEGGVQE